jgi:FAD/FMN-containing dehydrogenase
VGSSLPSLEAAVRGRVVTSASELARVGRDGSHLVGRPRAAVVPLDVDDVVAIVRWARRRRVPLVARGGGTSLDGESVPADGAVVVDLAAWNRIVEVRPEEGWARVGPGTVNRDLQARLEPYGAFFPPNPGSWRSSTVGGHVGTNASGPRSFRYGPTRSWIRSVELVLGTGERTQWGSLAPKRSVGPDLLSLFVGSEGTLGIATEVTVRLAPLPEVRRGLVVPVPPGARLGRVARTLAIARGTGLSAIEYLDARCAAELSGPGGLDRAGVGPVLLLELEADGPAEAAARLERIRGALRAAGVDRDPEIHEDADALWTVRGRASVVLDERVGARIREDVAVPLDRVDRLLRAVDRIAAAETVPVYLFGHLGEGNLHPNFVVAPESGRAGRIRSALLRAALSLGGTISGEHGIGALKRGFLAREIGRPGLAVLRAMKRACDPDAILNPGKLYPPDRRAGRSSRSPSGSATPGARPGAPTVASRRSERASRRARSPRRRGARP